MFLGWAFTALSSHAAILSNGSFETGDFTGWVTQTAAGDNLSVQQSLATHGLFSAQSFFDAEGPATTFIAQDIGVLAGGSTLTFDYETEVYDIFGPPGGGGDRVFSLTLRPNGGGTPIHTFEIWRALSGQSTVSGPQSASLDLSAYAGQSVRLSFETFIPGFTTGPGSFKLDHVALTAVPEPATCGLIAGAGLVGFAVWRRRGSKAQA